MEPIRLSALGRDVSVGNLYNYFTDEIMSGCIRVFDENLHVNNISAPKVERIFVHQQPDKFKYHMLGLNSHLLGSITRGSLDFHRLWFAGYLKTEHTQEDTNKSSTAQVDVIFRVIKRIETLDQQHFEPSNMFGYQLVTGGQATHLVEEVVYGVELICSMQRDVDLKCESKAIVEEAIYLAAKAYFDENMNSCTADVPAELKEVTCTVFTSTEAEKVQNGSFQAFCEWSRLVINGSEESPIEINLRDIPSQIEARLVSEKKNDIEIQKEMSSEMWKWIITESNSISKHPSIECVTPLEEVMCQFIDLLPPILNFIKTMYVTNRILNNMKLIPDLLADMKEWLIYRRREIQIMCSLLENKKLVMMDLKEIENRKSQNKRAKVFILKMDYTRDMLMERMKNYIGRHEDSERPVYHIVTSGRRQIEYLCKKLKVFSEQSTHCPDIDYLIGLVPSSSTLEDGKIISIPEKAPVPDVASNGLQNMPNKSFRSHQHDSSDFQPNSMLFPPVKSPLVLPTVYNLRHQLSPGIKTFVGPSGNYLPQMTTGRTDEHYQNDSSTTSSSHLLEENKQAIKKAESASNATFQKQEETGMMQLPKKDPRSGVGTGRDSCPEKMSELSVAARIENVNAKSKNELLQDQMNQSCEIIEKIKMEPREEKMFSSEDHENNLQMAEVNSQDQDMETDVSSDNPVSNQRIAEIFADESNRYADLIKKGHPNIYQLNAKEILANEDFRWFEIDRLDGSSPTRRDHKIIILMGATGCGKSTLINGMVNYILGVQWNDPFRFKCVREDEGVARNQAHSQTSSVTAYTLRHQEGMAIPYSITIIDTPGYGDTRGVKRDKEITAAIHRFLTQQEIPIDEIHAACFVATSGDSRLTATQRYIIDSVLSIFGKDMKENLRLLVTFADNADPPVVGACLSANFPTTSASGSIAYSKFNSSVLYCLNAKQGDDEFSFDQLFWDMGHENFKKFFYMLERMKGRDLTATREVIRSRRQLEQSLKDIEQEMEVCLNKIENIEIFQRKMKTYGHNMEATKNFTVEQTVMRYRKLSCPNGFFAYNCDSCKDTCERLINKKKSSLHKTKRPCEKKACKCPPSDHYVEELEWCMIPEKVSKTLQDMKAEYELNCDGKMTSEKLLNACSEDLQVARAKVLSLLEQVAKNVDLLESTALRSNVLSPSDYLSLMRSRVLEEQAPGYLTRLETLDDLQRMLAGGSSQPIRSTVTRPNQELTRQSPNTFRESYSAVTSKYGQTSNKGQTTQPPSVFSDGRESKPGFLQRTADFLGLGKTAESDNRLTQLKEKNKTWKV